MPKASSFSPLRLFTPIQLGFCFILFFLPWIELQCNLKDMPKDDLDSMKKMTGKDPTKSFSMYSQSGLQIASGDLSLGSDLKKLADDLKKLGGGKGGDGGMSDPDAMSKKTKDELKTAPLLYLYPVALIAGIAIALIPMPGKIRQFALAGCCVGALGIVVLQILIGFPLENEIKKQSEMMKGMGGMGERSEGGKSDTKSSKSVPEIFRVSWQIPLYLTFLLLIGAAGTSFLGGGPVKKPKRQAYDFDEDEEEEEDERPRKKKKVLSLDDDEEEEERPRKKPAPQPLPPEPGAAPTPGGNPFDFEGDDAPPKKPKRRDDEDDRPRK